MLIQKPKKTIMRGLMGFALLIFSHGFSFNAYAHKGLHLDEKFDHNNTSTKTTSTVDQLEIANKKEPNNAVIATRLAKQYIQMARDHENPEYYKKAKSILKPWWNKKYISTPMRLIRATLFQHVHKYQQASDDLQKVIKETPLDAQAWLTLSAIQIIQGNYQEAKESCKTLGIAASNWFSFLCYSQIYSFTGKAEQSLNIQQNLLQQLDAESTELRLWILSLMAETAMRLGDDAQAELNFKAVLKLKPNDHYVLRTYSDFLLRKKAYTKVLELLNDQTENNSLLVRQAIAAKFFNMTTQEKQWVDILDMRFTKASSTQDHTHDRDESLFRLAIYGDTKKALELAQNNWKHQKEPDDALMLLRAAYDNKSPDVAKVVIDWINECKLQDIRLQKYIHLLRTES
jgi:tetratricopeptide (TPR) repeat protein